MKIYILLDEYLNSEHHCDFVDVFDSAEAVLKYIAENQSDGHKFKYETREFQDPPTGINIDYPSVTPVKTPFTPGETYPLGITLNYPPCFNGGPCTNPHYDCINCPRPYGHGGTSFSSNSGDGIKPNTSCSNVSVNSEFLAHTDGTSSR